MGQSFQARMVGWHFAMLLYVPMVCRAQQASTGAALSDISTNRDTTASHAVSPAVGSIWAPPRIGAVGYGSLEPRILFASTVAPGAAAGLGYAGMQPYAVELRVEPLMVAPAQQQAQTIGLLRASVMFDTMWFGIGPTLGFATDHNSSGLLLGGGLRLGAMDGLSVCFYASALRIARSQAVAVGSPPPPTTYRFALGELAARLLVPLSRRAGLFGDAQVVGIGYAQLSAGLLTSLTETRGSGATTLLLRFGAALFEADAPAGSDSQDFDGGPLFGVGLERRL